MIYKNDNQKTGSLPKIIKVIVGGDNTYRK